MMRCFRCNRKGEGGVEPHDAGGGNVSQEDWGGGGFRAATSLHSITLTNQGYQNVQKDIPVRMLPSNSLQVKKWKSFSLGDCPRVGGWVPSTLSHLVGFDAIA